MPWGFVAAAAVGAAGSIVAANTQASGQRQAANTQAGMFNTIVGQEQPFLQPGYAAETSLSQLLGTAPATGPGGTASGTGLPGGWLTQPPTAQTLQNFPGYQFALQTGGQAVRNADTPGVGALSGPALKDLMNFNVGTALNQSWQPFQNYQNNIFNRLNSIAQLGQNAAGNLGNAGTQLGTGIAQAQAGAAASQAGGIVGASNAIGGSGVPLAYLMQGYNNQNNPASSAYWGGTTPFDPGQTYGAGSPGITGYDPSTSPGMIFNG